MGPRHFTSTCCQWETDTAVYRDGGIVETANIAFCVGTVGTVVGTVGFYVGTVGTVKLKKVI